MPLLPSEYQSAAAQSTGHGFSGDRVVVFSGEVIASTGLLRGKKKDFVVLTRTDLLRFKNRSKAVEFFPSLGLTRHVSNASSLSSTNTNLSSSALSSTIPPVLSDNLICSLSNVYAVFELGPMHVQIVFIDSAGVPKVTVLQLATRADAESWLYHLHNSISPNATEHTISDHVVETMRTYLQSRRDYYEPVFRVFRVVAQYGPGSGKHGSHKASTEDVSKLASSTTHAYMVIGHYSVHVLSIDITTASVDFTSNIVLPSNLSVLSCHGIVSLVHLAMSPRDSTFYLTFRVPLAPTHSLQFASYAAKFIIQAMRSSLEHLRPCWTEYPLTMDVPEYVQDEPLISVASSPLNDLAGSSYGINGFNMTLVAYCAAFGVPASISAIDYDISWDEDNGLIFKLLPPRRDSKSSLTSSSVTSSPSSSLPSSQSSYTLMELLCVFRTLRWNEAFGGISFAGISLAACQEIVDPYGAIELDQTRTSNGRRISRAVRNLSILKLEMQLLMLCSTSLRMLDLNGTVRPKSLPISNIGKHSVNSGEQHPEPYVADRGSGVIDVLMHVAKRATSNVDSFVFSGIPIDLYDFDYLVDVASTRAAHLRNLEIARCGLYERELTLLLQALEVHENTLEGLDISENPGRVSVHALNDSVYCFQYLRYLYLRKLLTTSEDHPLLSSDTLANMRLKKLVLDGTRLRPVSVKHLCVYLKSSKSASLVQLSVQSCGLSGADIGSILSALNECSTVRHPDFMAYIGDNSICASGFDEFLNAFRSLRSNVRQISMPRIEFPKESQLCSFFEVLASPECQVTYLDLSLLLIPDADASPTTCDILGEVFASNRSLLYLNLTGETSKLQVARIGHGIGKALLRLAENMSLQDLYITGNELSVDGAMLLAQALRDNRSLRRIYLDDNDINLQGFTAIVNSVVESGNRVIKYISPPNTDKRKQLKNLREMCGRLEEEIRILSQQRRAASSNSSSQGSGKQSSNGHLTELAVKLDAKEKASETLSVLEGEWNKVYSRLAKWLSANTRSSSDGSDDNLTEEKEKSRKAFERLKGCTQMGRKVSGGGRVIV
ncbi:hypothetical protein V1511DRAFT_458572 [Dipodascopsis uninucleata]